MNVRRGGNGMVNLRTPPLWSPATPPVAAGDIGAWPVLVLHYWAEWDHLLDGEMDRRLAPLREEFAGRICFRSCDVDRAENQPFIRGIGNVPALGCFIRGEWFKSLVGMRPEGELRSVLDTCVAAAAAPAGQSCRRGGTGE